MALSSGLCSVYRNSGGLSTVRLVEADKVLSCQWNRQLGGYSGFTFGGDARFVDMDVRGQVASLTEKVTVDSGISSVEHTLAVSVPACDALSRKALDELMDGSWSGVVALVTDNNGSTVVVGYSRQFGASRPLTLREGTLLSGELSSDAPSARIVLRSNDCERARAWFSMRQT